MQGCYAFGKYCRLHSVSGSLKEVKPIKPRSEKMDKVMKKEYVPQVKEMVAKGTKCSVNSPVCSGLAQGFHHLAGRVGDKLLDREKMIPCCNKCNLYVEENDLWARSKGLKLSKFSPENKTHGK